MNKKLNSGYSYWVLGFVFAMISAVIYGSMPLMTKYLYASVGYKPQDLVFHRLWIVVIFLFVFIKMKGYSLKIDVKLLPILVLLGIFGMALTPFLLFSSYQYIPSGIATTLHFLYPVLVAGGSIVFLRQKITVQRIIALLIAVLGLFLFADFSGNINFVGLFYAFLSSVTYAIYILIVGTPKVKKIKEVVIAFYMSLIGAIVFGVYTELTQGIVWPTDTVNWVELFIFAFLVGVGGALMFQMGVVRIGPQTASIVSAFEPIVSLIIGVTVLSEELTFKIVLGILLILVAVFMVIMTDIVEKNKNKSINSKS